MPILETLVKDKAFDLASRQYDAIYEDPSPIFLEALTDQESLSNLSQGIWKVKPNKKRLYRCFTAFFNSPIFSHALNFSSENAKGANETMIVLKKMKALTQTEIVTLWQQPVLPLMFCSLFVILKHALLEKQLLEEILIMLLFRPSLMQELIMREKSADYMKTKEYLDTIEINWFFGKFKCSKTSLSRFHELLKQDEELYGFFMSEVKKEMGLGRNATEGETFAYLEKCDITKMATGIVNQIKKDKKKAEYYIERFRKFLEDNLSEDLKQSLDENPITAAMMKKVLIRA